MDNEDQCYLLSLPIENILIILSSLNIESLIKLSSVNSQFNSIISNSLSLWSSKIDEDFLLDKDSAISRYDLLNKFYYNEDLQRSQLTQIHRKNFYSILRNNNIPQLNDDEDDQDDNQDEESEEEEEEEEEENQESENDENDQGDQENHGYSSIGIGNGNNFSIYSGDFDFDYNLTEENQLLELKYNSNSNNNNNNNKQKIIFLDNNKIINYNKKETSVYSSFQVYKLLYNRFNQNIYHHYKTMRYIWNRIELWMEMYLPQMKRSFLTISTERYNKLIESITSFKLNQVQLDQQQQQQQQQQSSLSTFNQQINSKPISILPADYLCSILIHNGQKITTKYGLLGTVTAYDSVINIIHFSLDESFRIYQTLYSKSFYSNCWFIAGSLSRRYYGIVIQNFQYLGKNYIRGQILLVTTLKKMRPILISNSYWEFMDNHATMLERKILTTRKDILFRYPEQSQYTGESFTNGIRIKATALFIPEDLSEYTFYYRITISMDKDEDQNKSCQLIRRHWTITTSKGASFVEGAGVIGLFPIITPGSVFEYCSRCELDESLDSLPVIATMNGYFNMVRLNNRDEIITAIVPLFFLTINQQ